MGGGEPRAKSVVAEEHFARVPVDRLSKVREVRREVAALGDQRIRAEHSVAIAERGIQVAQARVQAAEADEQVARESLQLAETTGNRKAIRDAESVLDRRSSERELAEAHVRVATHRHERAEAEVAVARARVDVAKARLEREKYDALVASNDAASDEYEADAFAARIDERRRTQQQREAALAEAEANLQKALTSARELEGDLDRRPVRGDETERDEVHEKDHEKGH